MGGIMDGAFSFIIYNPSYTHIQTILATRTLPNSPDDQMGKPRSGTSSACTMGKTHAQPKCANELPAKETWMHHFHLLLNLFHAPFFWAQATNAKISVRPTVHRWQRHVQCSQCSCPKSCRPNLLEGRHEDQDMGSRANPIAASRLP
jgi:hypothetical protein